MQRALVFLIAQTQSPVASVSPCVDVSFVIKSDRVLVSRRDLDDVLALQLALDEFSDQLGFSTTYGAEFGHRMRSCCL